MDRLLKILSALLLTVAYVGCGGGGGGGGTVETATLDDVDPGVLAGGVVVDSGAPAADSAGGSSDSSGSDSGSDEEAPPADGGSTPPAGDGTPPAAPAGGTGGSQPAPALTNNEALFDVVHYSYQTESVEDFADIQAAFDALNGWEGEGARMALELLSGELRDEIVRQIQEAIVVNGHDSDPMSADTLQLVAQIIRADRSVDRSQARIDKIRELMVGTALESALAPRLTEAEAILASLEVAIDEAVNIGLHDSFTGPVDAGAMFHEASSGPLAGNLSDMAAFEAAIIDAVGGLMDQVQTGDEDAIELGTAFYAAYEALGPLGVSSALNRDNIAAKALELADVDRLGVALGAPMPGLGDPYSVLLVPAEGPAESEETTWAIEGDEEMTRSLSAEGMLLSSDGDLTDKRLIRAEFRNEDGRRSVVELEIVSLPIEIVRRKVMASIVDIAGDAIAGARIELLEGPDAESRIARGEHVRLLRAESDELGLAHLVYVAEGLYFARVSAPGYETVVVPVDVLADAGDYAMAPVTLHEAPVLPE